MRGNKSQKIKGDGNVQAGGDIVFNFESMGKKLPALMATVLPKLYEAIEAMESKKTPRAYDEYKIDCKIEHNNLKKYKTLVEQYGIYGAAVESVYDVLDAEKVGAKNKILRHFKLQYDIAKSDMVKSLDDATDKEIIRTIREKSDDIMDKVLNTGKDELINSSNLPDVTRGELDLCMVVMVCHAFIECKILEAPIK